MLQGILHFIPWYWWIGGILLIALAVYLGLLPVLIKAVAAIFKALVEAWRALPPKGKIAVVAVVAIVAIIVGFRLWLAEHDANLTKSVKASAIAENDKSWRERERLAIEKSQFEAKATEKAHQKDLDSIKTQAAKDLENAKATAKAKHDKDVADALAGRLSLRIAASACPSGANVPDASGRGNSAAGATIELPREVTGGLYSLADGADARVADLIAKLNYCWQIVASDRKAFSTSKGAP